MRFSAPVTLVGAGPIDAAGLGAARRLAPGLVAADGAADRLAAAGLLPDLVVGDMDSIADPGAWRAAGRSRLIHLPEQETTDFEKCLYATEAPGYLALGFAGGRIDHTLAVLHAMLARPEKTVALIGEVEAMALVPPGGLRLRVGEGARVSLFPLVETTGTLSQGLAWPVAGLTLAPGRRIATSNRAVAPEIAVAFDRPGALLMVARAALPGLVAALGVPVRA